jgi:hypothetical protein
MKEDCKNIPAFSEYHSVCPIHDKGTPRFIIFLNTAEVRLGYNMKICFFFLMAVLLLYGLETTAQKSDVSRIHPYLDFTVALGNQEGTAAFSYVRNWRLGKTGKPELGLGLRWTAYTGTKTAFYTAPARLSRSSSVPFLGVFSGHEEQNVDTLTIRKPFTGSLNLSANAGYRFAKKWYAGLNIDLLGFTVGHTTSSVLISNGSIMEEPVTKPSTWNVLLTGDLDYGSLNSEFFVKYNISSQWDIKLVYQFFFTEYNTTTIYQTAPDGTEVKRFRNKANLLGVGVSYDL